MPKKRLPPPSDMHNKVNMILKSLEILLLFQTNQIRQCLSSAHYTKKSSLHKKDTLFSGKRNVFIILNNRGNSLGHEL